MNHAIFYVFWVESQTPDIKGQARMIHDDS